LAGLQISRSIGGTRGTLRIDNRVRPVICFGTFMPF